MCCLISCYCLILFELPTEPLAPVAVYPLDAKHGGNPLLPSFSPPGNLAAVQFTDGPGGKPGGSCAFSGSQSSYIQIPKDDRLDTRYSITLLAMVFPDETAGPIVQFSPPGSYGTHFWVVNSGTTLFFRITRRGDYLQTTILSSALLKPRQWFYVGATYDYSTGVVRNWIDGKMVGEVPIGSMELSTDQFIRIGSGAIPADVRTFKGRISCLQIYNRALTQEEIVAAKDACSHYKRSKL